MNEKKDKLSYFKEWVLDFYTDPGNWQASSAKALEVMRKEFNLPYDKLPSERTIRNWRQSQGWNEEIYKRFFEAKRFELPQLLEAAFREAKAGSFKHFEYLMEYYKKFKAKSEFESSIENWKDLMRECLVPIPPKEA